MLVYWIPMSIFKTKPTEEELDSLYREYNDRLIEMAYDNTTDFADICCDYAYAIKMPKYNPRGHKHLEVEPIFSKNPHTTEYTASTTKLLTSLILLEYAPYLKEKKFQVNAFLMISCNANINMSSKKTRLFSTFPVSPRIFPVISKKQRP